MVAGYSGCTLLADGRVLLVPCSATSLLIYDPRSDTIRTSAAVTPPELQQGLGGASCGSGVLLADGRALPAVGPGAYLGGCVLPDGRVVFTPYYARHLVVWEPGLGAAYGRDVALAAFWNHP